MRVEKSQAILALIDSFQELHLEWQAWVTIAFVFVCLFFFLMSNFMKSSPVYEASLCSFVLRFETMIWPGMGFDISLQNFKKPASSRYFLTVNRKKKRSEEY